MNIKILTKENQDVLNLEFTKGLKEIIEKNNQLNLLKENFYLAKYITDESNKKKLVLKYENSFDLSWSINGLYYHSNDQVKEDIVIVNFNY
jgi:hypothetical protein